MIVLLREFLSGFAEHGAAGTVLSEEASRRVGFSASLRATPGRPLRRRLDAGGSAFAFCPREGGSEELSGVFGGPPRLTSSSAMRAFNAFTCASNSSMRSSRPAICAMSPSMRGSSDATSWAPSLLGESISLSGIESVNQLAALGSTPQTRVTTPQRRE
jgi:hypothetical protein